MPALPSLAHLRKSRLSATVLNSAQSAGARAAALVEACGPDEFVFVSPEQLSNTETREALRRSRPGLFVVDEAHLVSQCGQDLRQGARLRRDAVAAAPTRSTPPDPPSASTSPPEQAHALTA